MPTTITSNNLSSNVVGTHLPKTVMGMVMISPVESVVTPVCAVVSGVAAPPVPGCVVGVFPAAGPGVCAPPVLPGCPVGCVPVCPGLDVS